MEIVRIFLEQNMKFSIELIAVDCDSESIWADAFWWMMIKAMTDSTPPEELWQMNGSNVVQMIF